MAASVLSAPISPESAMSAAMQGAESTRRTAFFVSDSTGITSETLGHSLLTQFDNLLVEKRSLRFVDTPDRARDVRRRIDEAADRDGQRPLVFSTLINPECREIVMSADALFLDFFETFMTPLEQELGLKSALRAGRSHGVTDEKSYTSRIEAVNFTLSHDDGSTTKKLEDAHLIIVGISRTGKTPTCLYLSLHYGLRVANFPITEDDLEHMSLPRSLEPYKRKLVGLTIDAQRLKEIREQRFPNSRYATLSQCDYEVRQAEALYRRVRVPYLCTSNRSIEELAAKIVDLTAQERANPGGVLRGRL